MENSNISLRKKKQLVEPSDINLRNLKTGDTICVVQSGRGLHLENLNDRTHEEILEVFENFNDTLKEGETKRTVKHMFKVTQLIQLEKI